MELLDKVSNLYGLRSSGYIFYYSILQRWSPRGRPWPWPRRSWILKSLTLATKVKFLALASKPQVLKNSPVLGSRTALFFEQLKFRWKTPETSRKIFEHLFCFPHLEHRRTQGRGEGGQGARVPLNENFTNDKNLTKKPIVSSVSVSFLAFFAYNSN